MQPNQYGQQSAPTMARIPGFSEPTTGEGGNPLKIRELLGRACIIYPKRFNPATPGKIVFGAPERDSVTFDVLVMDGPVPLAYGSSEARDGTGGPAVYALDALPAMITGVIASGSEVVRAVKRVLDTAPSDVIPCRVVQGTLGNRPFLLTALGGDLDPQAANAAQVRQHMLSVLTAIAGETFVNPQPREINGGPRKPAGQATAAFNGAVQATQQGVNYPPAAPAAQVQYPPAQPAAAVPPPPPNWDPAIWNALTPEQRAPFLPTH